MRFAALALLVGIGGGAATPAEEPAAEASPPTPSVKGGDGRYGGYDPVPDWWKPAPDHDDTWTWGEVSGVAVDTPDRIIVAVWGDRSVDGEERPDGAN